MKKCTSCQTVQEDTSKFCNQCGASEFLPVDVQPATVNCDPNIQPGSRKKRNIFILAGTSVVLIVAIAAYFLFNPVDLFMRSIYDDDFSEAATIYQEKIVRNSDAYQKVYDKVSVYTVELLEQYKNEEIAYDYLVNKLTGIEQLGSFDQAINYAYSEAFYLHSCRETYASAEKAFANGDYVQAIPLYAQVADADFENGLNAVEKYTQSVDLFRNEVVSSAQEYIEAGEYSVAIMLLEDALYVIPGDSVILSVQQSCIQAEYDDTIQHLIEEVRLYTANKDYVGALNFLDFCIPTYSEALILQQERNNCLIEYKAHVINCVQEYITTKEYSIAMTLLDEALYFMPDDLELLSSQQSCIQAEYDDTIQRLVEEVRLYTANKDYVGALSTLDSYILTYPEDLILQQERNSCLAEYESYVIEESLRLANAGEFNHALSLAEAGLNHFTSTHIKELSLIYKSHIPVILGEMEMFQNDTSGGSWASKTNETNTYLVDNYGNEYAHSLSVGCGSITYLVNFKYQTFSGTVGFPKGLESDGARASATLTILGDGEKIAEFADINDESKPESFSLDISAYEKITLKWECSGYNIWNDWGYFATIFDGTLVPVPLDLPSES